MGYSEYSVVSQELEKELYWLDRIITRAINIYGETTYYEEIIAEDGSRTSQKSDNSPIESIKENHFPEIKTNYSRFIIENNLSFYERLLLILTLVPHLSPEFLEKKFKQDHLNKIPQIGLSRMQDSHIFIPTGLTFLFLVNNRTSGGRDLAKLLFGASFLAPESKLFRQKVIFLEPPMAGSLFFSGKLILSQSYFQLFINPVIHENTFKEERA
jgi:hypothetical protein